MVTTELGFTMAVPTDLELTLATPFWFWGVVRVTGAELSAAKTRPATVVFVDEPQSIR